MRRFQCPEEKEGRHPSISPLLSQPRLIQVRSTLLFPFFFALLPLQFFHLEEEEEEEEERGT